MDTGSWEPFVSPRGFDSREISRKEQRRLSAVAPLLNTFLAAGILFLVLPYIIHSVASYNLSLIDQYPMIFGAETGLRISLLLQVSLPSSFRSSRLFIFYSGPATQSEG